ncbi:MAG: MDR family oxidoreductase [Propionicimonas sp.]|uniref:MDR family oxidoreductase n=1 Tax=Propionicimonas sp. TaxID=1955623 RepID=UPI003D0F3FC2
MGRAIVIRKNESGEAGAPVNTAALDEVGPPPATDGPVLVDVAYSGINYKDGLALTGRPGVVRSTPLIGGIDLVGTVRESEDGRWRPGDEVILNGTGLSETHNGAFATQARVSGELLVKRPASISAARAAAIGTAGYTAALCVLRLEREHVNSTAEQPILVTGATGGVGSIAVLLLAAAGHHVAALTGRVEAYGDYLRGLGAEVVVPRADLLGAGRPLQSQRWSGVVDTVGGEVLANAISQTRYGSTVTACGLAGSASLPASVVPFILRAVTLAGVDSVVAPLADREAAWTRLARDLDLDVLDGLTETVPLAGAIDAAARLLAGEAHGRIAVDVRA